MKNLYVLVLPLLIAVISTNSYSSRTKIARPFGGLCKQIGGLCKQKFYASVQFARDHPILTATVVLAKIGGASAARSYWCKQREKITLLEKEIEQLKQGNEQLKQGNEQLKQDLERERAQSQQSTNYNGS